MVSQATKDEWEVAVAYVTRCLLEGVAPDPRFTRISRHTSPAFLGEREFRGKKPTLPSAAADDYIASSYRELEARESILANWRDSFDEAGVPRSAGGALAHPRPAAGVRLISRCGVYRSMKQEHVAYAVIG